MSKPTDPLKAVLYTDGGCKPSRGIGGWGIHGYTYTDVVPKQGSGCRHGTLTAKGYDKSKSSQAVSVQGYVDGWGSLPEATNNIAELTAATKALTVASGLEITALHLRVDSKYVIEGITKWSAKWEANDWVKNDGTEVANKAHWQELRAQEQALTAKGVAVSWDWVKGHSGDIGNELADEAAGKGIAVGRKGLTEERIRFSEARGYWSPKAEINRMFSQSRWYFNSNLPAPLQSADGRWVYHLGEHGRDDELFGKRISDACFSVLYMKEPEPILELIRTEQDKLDPEGYHSVVVARLDRILAADTYLALLREGELFVKRATNRLDLYNIKDDPLKDEPLTRELRPPRLAFTAVEALTTLESILSDYLAGPEARGLTVTDITDLLYDIDLKGKTRCKLKPELNNTVKSIPVNAAYNLAGKKGEIQLTLSIGIDIAKRNTLSALAVRNPKVKLVTWRESDNAFRYGTIIEAGDDIGIWAGIYSNLRMLT